MEAIARAPQSSPMRRSRQQHRIEGDERTATAPDEIEISGLELLGIYGDQDDQSEDDDDDDVSCESYCADSVPRAYATKRQTAAAADTAAADAPMRSCLKPHSQRHAMPYRPKASTHRIVLRRASLASQLTDEDYDDESVASLDFNDSVCSETSATNNEDAMLRHSNHYHSCSQQSRIVQSSNRHENQQGQQRAANTTSLNTTNHTNNTHTSRSYQLSDFESDDDDDDPSESSTTFRDFAEDSVHLLSTSRHKQHAVRSFSHSILLDAPEAVQHGGVGRAA